MKDAKHALLYRMVMPDHLCPFGLKSKDLLERQGYQVEDHHLRSHAETEAFKREQHVETTPQTFIKNKRIGGYDDLKKFFGKKIKDKNETSYQPVIAVFATAFFMALAIVYAMTASLDELKILKFFVAFSMCILAILKLRDLSSFSNQFLGYDLLAQKIVRYAYVYPFAEAFAGIGMIAGIGSPIVAPISLFIGTVGAISVVKAVYIDKRELKCACVGGNSTVPLGFVSLTENLMMVGMGLWMLLGPYSHFPV
jgi:glutaredoxin